MPMSVTKDEQIRADIQELHGLGYVQQLFRDMGGFSNFAISFTTGPRIMGSEEDMRRQEEQLEKESIYHEPLAMPGHTA